MPSKILGMMCSSTPSVVTGNGNSEVATVFKDSNGGVFLDGTSVSQIHQEIVKYKNNQELCEKSGLTARNYVVNNFAKRKVLTTFAVTLNQLTKH
jgi:colanic acid biosynthesis glycosyl transferase WcaI